MKNIHVECLPDEYLVKKLGFTRKSITHHQGKSRVFYTLCKVKNQLAVVDEDPGSGKTTLCKMIPGVVYLNCDLPSVKPTNGYVAP